MVRLSFEIFQWKPNVYNEVDIKAAALSLQTWHMPGRFSTNGLDFRVNCIVHVPVVSRNISEKQWLALGLITLAGCFNRSVMKSPLPNLIDKYEGMKEGGRGGRN